MSDDADRAETIRQAVLDLTVGAARRAARGVRANPGGRCLWCGDLTRGGRWCGPDCRDDWERAHAAARLR
jgi:hypothetical protein